MTHGFVYPIFTPCICDSSIVVILTTVLSLTLFYYTIHIERANISNKHSAIFIVICCFFIVTKVINNDDIAPVYLELFIQTLEYLFPS